MCRTAICEANRGQKSSEENITMIEKRTAEKKVKSGASVDSRPDVRRQLHIHFSSMATFHNFGKIKGRTCLLKTSKSRGK